MLAFSTGILLDVEVCVDVEMKECYIIVGRELKLNMSN